MVSIETVYRLTVCGTEIPQTVWEEDCGVEDTEWWDEHLPTCDKCKADTKEALRQTIATLNQHVEGLNLQLAGYVRGMADRREILQDAKSLLSSARMPDQVTGLARAEWIERCNRSLDLHRP